MRVIGESKTVDLSKKLTVEMTVGELAMLMAVLGSQTSDETKECVAGSSTINPECKSNVQRLDDYKLFSEIKSVLKSEGVAD